MNVQRLSSMPKSRNVDQGDVSLYKSLSFRDKIRSTFTHKVSLESKTEKVIYGKMAVLGDEGVGKTALIQRCVDNIFSDCHLPTSTVCNFDVKALVECDKKKKLKGKEKSIKDSLRKKALTFSQSKEIHLGDNLRKATLLNIRSASSASVGRSKKRESSLRRTLSFGKTQMQQITKKENFKRLKEFNFQLVDSPGNIKTFSPATYRASLSEANGFIVLCSYDTLSSFQYMANACKDIKNVNDRVPVILVINKADLSSQDNEHIGDRVLELSRELDLQWCEVSAAKGIGFKNLIDVIMNETTHFKEQEDIADQVQIEYDDFLY